MSRDKLITIRIEGEKRQAFGDLAKSQNTDTASLLYDFISGCLDGRIDISLVMGKKQWIDKIDNQIDTNRLDKVESTTQRLDERVGSIAKKLNDWVEAFSDRLSDCDRELSEKITSLEHRLNALSIQLNSQQIDSIDTDSQKDRQGETLIKEALRLDFIDDQNLIDEIEDEIEDEMAGETLPKVETVDETDSTIESVTGEAVTIGNKPWYTAKELLDCHYPGWPTTSDKLREKADKERWPKRTRRGSKGNPYEYQAVLPD